MSYCRCSDTNDVYVWCGIKYQVHLCMGKKEVLDRAFTFGVELDESFETAKETFDYLIKLRKLGFKIPQYAISRLQQEFTQ